MKIIKKIAAIMLSVMMVLGMCSVVGAEGTTESGKYGDNDGKITITGAIDGQTYTIYRILKLESFSRDNADRDKGNYAYTVETGWENFVSDTNTGGAYLTKDLTSGYVTWNASKATDNDKADFAKVALKYAKENEEAVKNTKKEVPATSAGATFTDLPLGYYLVDSSTGALCSLDTTDKEVNIQEKNGVPFVEKKIVVGTDEKETSTANIGDTVNFKTTIKAKKGAQNYVLHDKMSEGLTFISNSIDVKKQGVSTSFNQTSDYKVVTETTNMSDRCTFHIEFTESFCNSIKADTDIIVTYSATLNKNAEIGTTTGNTNKTHLSYGNNSNTKEATTTTKTFEVPVFKFTNTKNPSEGGTTKTPLKDATFKLSTDDKGNNVIKLKQKDSTTNYFVDSAGKESVTTNGTGKFTIKGLAAGTYYLTETKQPDGYNKLKEAIKIVIAGEDGTIKYGSKSKSDTELNQMSADGAVEVENKTGSILPSTGGMGTTLFYIFGAILVVGSGVVLITKKRMK